MRFDDIHSFQREGVEDEDLARCRGNKSGLRRGMSRSPGICVFSGLRKRVRYETVFG